MRVVFEPKGRTVGVLLGVWGFVWAVLVVVPNSVRQPPAGDAGHSSLLRQRRLTRRKPTLPGAEQSDDLAAVIPSCGQWLRLACPTGFNGDSAAGHTGFVVRPPMAGALPIHPSAVRGATGHDSSRLTVSWFVSGGKRGDCSVPAVRGGERRATFQ